MNAAPTCLPRPFIRSLAMGLAAAAVIGLAACVQPASAPVASDATVAAHVAAATAAAGSDLGALMGLCTPAPATRPSQADSEKSVAALMALAPPAPGRAFPMLSYVGARWVSAWALQTSAGIILIDALNDENEAETLIEGGLRKLGLDPAQIRYVIVTHGHGDHYGGARRLAGRYGARIVMSEADWTMTETKLEFDLAAWGPPPKRDIVVGDGDRITLGDTVVTLYLTPGHTRGTLSPVFDVRDVAGASHRVLLWGGTAFNFGADLDRLASYIAATERMRRVVAADKIDVLLSNHAAYDSSFAKLDRLRAEPELQPNPFVMGTPTVERALSVMGECAQATRDRFALRG